MLVWEPLSPPSRLLSTQTSRVARGGVAGSFSWNWYLGSLLRGFAGGVADGNSDADVGAIGPHVLPKGIFGTLCALGRELGPTGASF